MKEQDIMCPECHGVGTVGRNGPGICLSFECSDCKGEGYLTPAQQRRRAARLAEIERREAA